MDMSGVRDVRQGSGRMEGTLKGGRATVLSVGGLEYVSLPDEPRTRTGRRWLCSTGSRTFGDFPNVRRIAMLLRTSCEPTPAGSGGGRRHVRGTMERRVALREVPDPTFKPFIGRLPATVAHGLWTGDTGKPVCILPQLKGEAGRRSSTVEPSGFGAAPSVRRPTADQVLRRPSERGSAAG